LGNVLLVVHGLKVFWGRTRFRDLASAAEFTPWYEPRGITGHTSFPSGHAAMGWMLLPLIVWLAPRPRLRWLAVAGVGVWAVAVAISRVVVGAHYLSDVLFSSFSSLAIAGLWYQQRRASLAAEGRMPLSNKRSNR
jgi:membrane-associated phospholipid phosphatase